MAKQNPNDSNKISAQEYRNLLEQLNARQKQAIDQIEEEKRLLTNIFDIRGKMVRDQEIMNLRQEMINNELELRNTLAERGYKIHGNLVNNLKKEQKEQAKIIKQTEKRIGLQNLLLTSVKSMSDSFLKSGGSMRTFFMDSDKAIKSVTLQLGLSGERAAQIRDSFEDSAGFAARMGVNMGELTSMATAYADETGRARLLNEANLEAITLMAKGTDMGAESAAQMAAQYELMGFSAVDTAKEVQRIVDTTERMGVNTSKVFKTINANFKTLQKYTFRNGVKSMADMAIYAEKFKINMDSVFEPMERGRRLDSVIEMSAQLQVLGGQFANLSDPLSMLFESRNDPEAYMKRINEMTKGMVVLNKTADGFSFDIASPMAKDQLAQAAAALGMTTEELTQQAFRMREIQQTRSQMFGKGFTPDEKNIIEGLAKFDKTTGRMFVEIGGQRKDISKLAKDDIKALETQKSSLEARALAAQTFDEAFANTVMELKASLLPMINGINSILTTIRPIMTSIGDWANDLSKTSKTLLKGAGMLVGGLMVAAPIVSAMRGGLNLLRGGGGILGGGKVASTVSKTTSVAPAVGKSVGGGAARGGGMRALGAGAGVGLAGAGIGGGVMMAAKGISQLADSMAKLDKDQVEALETIATTLAIAFPAAAIGVGILAAVAAPAAVPLLALGAAIAGIGLGIGVATAGIGYMASSMGELGDVDLMGVASGLGAVSLATIPFANPLTALGLAGTTASIMAIGSSADDLERVGGAFANINTVLRGSSSQYKDVKDTIQAIADTEISANGGIAELMSVLSRPLTVEFADNEVAMVANVGVNIDGREMKKVITDPAYNAIQLIDQQTGKRGV